MPTKLTERALVKDLLQIARADTLLDPILMGMIETTSKEAERLCRRKFAKSERTEFYKSYDQDFADPTPQYIWLDAPVDTAEDLVINWAMFNQHATAGTLLNPEDYTLDAEEGLILVHGMTGLSNQAVPNTLGRPIYQYSPTGFRVTYTGGYALNTKPVGEPDDPLDDYGVVQVPDALKYVIARKVADDYEASQRAKPWDEIQRQGLKPWMKKDILQ